MKAEKTFNDMLHSHFSFICFSLGMIAITLVKFNHRTLAETSNIFLARPLHDLIRVRRDVLPFKGPVQALVRFPC
ncbi:hypothetical protein, partial [Staphylococcus haemolyticus]|uniref:hypothetical protein n=1 Tax=Staphylococcus haemolyticus TaxID=1283 RepID=UPI003BA1C98C